MALYKIYSGGPDDKDGNVNREQVGAETWEQCRVAADANNSGLNGGAAQVGSFDDWPQIFRAFLWLDTSVIPTEESINNATLYICPGALNIDVHFDIVIQTGQPTVHHYPCVVGDYNQANVSGNGGSRNTVHAVAHEYLAIPLNPTGISWINKGAGAITKLCLRHGGDIAGVPPTGINEIINMYNGNGTYKPAYIEINKPVTDAVGKASINTNFEAYIYSIIENVKAERDSTQSAVKLYGNIRSLRGKTILEKGFEYIIQDEEPTEEATGIKVVKERPAWIESWDVGEYWCYEYEGNDVDFWDRLYFLEEDTIWWFRAYCLDDEENKYIAIPWMKSVPTMTTFECTEVKAQEAQGNGEMTDGGANTVTRRGFRIIKEYVGDLLGLRYYDNIFGDYTLMGEIEMETLTGPGGTITGYIWRGTFYRDALWPKSQTSGDFEVGIYDNIIGGGMSGEAFGIYLKPNDNYKIVAIAVNQHGMGFGEEVDLKTLIYILPSDPEKDEIVSETSAEKTVKLGVIPGEATVTRIGIRLGRTKGCNEIHVYEDGEWGSHAEVTFYIEGFEPGCTYYKMPYIVIDYGDYSEEILAMPDYTNPDKLEEYLDDYPVEIFPELEEEEEEEEEIIDSSVGDISYRTIIREIKCEVVGEQSLIDYYGRRRSKTINNHMIQSKSVCIIIINNYLDKFQRIKLKVVIEIDMPIPFEREDVILLGDGKIKYREDGQGLITFKADGEGELLQRGYILAKMRKIDISYIASTETEAILSLELEV